MAGPATALETLLSSAAALTLAGIGLASGLMGFGPINSASVAVLVIGLLAVTLGGTYVAPRILSRIRPDIPRVATTRLAQVLSYIAYGGAWLALGAGLAHLVNLVSDTPVNLITASGAMALAWFAGFVAVPVPNGLGVREAVLVGVLAGSLDAQGAVVVALAHRVAWTAVVIVGGLLAAIYRARQ